MLSDSSSDSRRAGAGFGVFAWGGLIVAVAMLAWCNSFHGPFVLDDMPAIAENPTIRSFASAFAPPGDGQTVSGRPLVNLSFALNWAIGGGDVRSYHTLNLAIHVLAALALFGVARRTLLMLRDRPALAASATPLAFSIALLWALHPLQTESVTYISQRAESLAGLWLLVTLYAAIRGAESAKPFGWHVLAFGSCLLGMASKEVMYAAPLLVLLHDRAFGAGTFRAALGRRPWFYVGLASTWVLLGWLVWHTGNRGRTAGLGLGISPWSYLLTQCDAIVHYLRLTFWPAPLVLDYGFSVVKSAADVWAQGVFLLALLGATLVGLVRNARWSFFGVWFFLLLAPSSSVLPVATQTIAEHRMYLPLAAVIAASGLAAWSWFGKRALFAVAAAAIALGTLTVRRNADYHSAIGLWQDTTTKRPDNARAFSELGNSLLNAGRAAESLPVYERAVQLLPNFPKAHHNYGSALSTVGQLDAAAAQFELAIRQQPDLPEAYYGLGNVRREQKRVADAVACYEGAIRLRPGFALAHNNLGNLLAATGRINDAFTHFAAALAAQPDLVDAEFNWGNVLAGNGRPADAVAHYQAALRLAPDFSGAHENLGVTFAMLGRLPEALRELEAAQRLSPDRESIRQNLATVRARLTR